MSDFKLVFKDMLKMVDLESVSSIENSLVNYEIISLVFLLYDENVDGQNEMPVALEKLKIFQSSSELRRINLILKWAAANSSNDLWKLKFLEALSVTQLNSMISSLGFDYEAVKEEFVPDDYYTSYFIHPIKKILYKICESLCVKDLRRLQETLRQTGVSILHTEYCEILFMDLLQGNFINVGSENKIQCNIDALINILIELGLQNFCSALQETQDAFNSKIPLTHELSNSEFEVSFLNEINDMCKNMNKQDSEKLKTDEVHSNDSEYYPIKNKKNVGICLIINQVSFVPSKENLMTRKGSDKDKTLLKFCFRKLGFKVFVETDVKSTHIKSVLNKTINSLTSEQSVFVLCILSHGKKGLFYGSDSIPVSVDDVKEMLYNDKLKSIPKVLIIQACQGTNVNKKRLVADGPHAVGIFDKKVLQKADMLVYWATIAGHEALRHEDIGSIFIQSFCYMLIKCCNERCICDIILLVNEFITRLTLKPMFEGMVQVAEYSTTFRKKLKLNATQE